MEFLGPLLVLLAGLAPLLAVAFLAPPPPAYAFVAVRRFK